MYRARLEGALKELIESTEIESVLLLNSSGEVSAAFGKPITISIPVLLKKNEFWLGNDAIFVNLVALGEQDDKQAPVPELAQGRNGRGRFPHSLHGHLPEFYWQEVLKPEELDNISRFIDNKPLNAERVDAFISCFKPGALTPQYLAALKQSLADKPLTVQKLSEVVSLACIMNRNRDSVEQQNFNRTEYKELLKKHGIHWFIEMMPADSIQKTANKDIQLRFMIMLIALAACVAAGFAFRTIARSLALRLKLVRAQAAAGYLRDQNMAAAGLVHETRNPLNIIRGLTQMIGKESENHQKIEKTANEIIEEVDRITGRLNQFLAYSKPREAVPAPVKLHPLVSDIFNLLECDREEKKAVFSWNGGEITIKADYDMLRQMCFNLILNSVQAVADSGKISVSAGIEEGKAFIEINDNGPGIPDELREEVFRPYFTRSANGTGLGLTIVKQIVSAHGWDLKIVTSSPGATTFRIGGIELCPEA